MRTVKFRGMSRNTGKWIYGCFLKVGDQSYIVNSFSDNEPIHGAVRSETVGERAGLKDRNEKDIYEGDIVMYSNDYPGMWGPSDGPADINNDFAVIEWSDEARWNLNCKPFAKNNREDWADWIHEYGNSLEVIGNVHENRELLEAKP